MNPELTFQNIRFVPCVHRRVTFAEAVRRAALEWRPDLIAVELPATLGEWIVRGVMRLPQVSAVCFEDEGRQGELAYVPIDPCDAMIEAARLGCEHGLAVEMIDLDLPGLQEPFRELPDDLMIDEVGLEAYVRLVAPYVSTRDDDYLSLAREHHMARRLQVLGGEHERVLCVLGMGHYLRVRGLLERGHVPLPEELLKPSGVPIIDRRPGAMLAHVAPSSLGDLLGEIPYVTYLFEQDRERLELESETAFDKLDAIMTIFKEAEQTYQETYKETITLTQWKSLLQYTRNLALIRGQLRPDRYEVVIAARGIVDGDYGHEVLDLAGSYPPQEKEAEGLRRFKIRNGRGIVEGREEKFRLLPRQEHPPHTTIQLRFRRRPPKELLKQWKEMWERAPMRFGICSWPPEDERQERFMDYARKRALQVISEDRKQVEEFSTTLLDGLDVRESVRNWHTGRLYVQSTPQPQGRVGAVVIIFEDSPLDFEPLWKTTLYAEHQNESDISFYSTPLGENVVGPRICRTEFGGILSIYPSMGIPDIWSLGPSGEIKTCAEALLAAGILFSPDHYIAYVAKKPPRPSIKQLAELYHKHIIFLPLHGFSAAHLKQVRHFHILDGHDVRAWAGDYIFDE